jgi:hypothetical protein
MYAGLHVKCLLFWFHFNENPNVSENFNNTKFEKKKEKKSRKSVRGELTVAVRKSLC